MSPKDVIKLAQEKGCRVLDLRFTDFPGMWQHTSYPITELTEDCFEEGFGFVLPGDEKAEGKDA